MNFAKILGTGSYLPEKVLTNADLEKMVDTSDAWIVERSGIRKRHIVAPHETTVSMAEKASERALKKASISADKLDLIIATTCTPEKIFPSTACLLQKRLQAGNCPAFDLSAACAGFIYALSVADQYIRSGAAEYVLVVGTEAMSRILDWQDRTTCVLFGDGAGAVVLGRAKEPGVMATKLYADGTHQDILHMPTGILQEEAGLPSMIVQMKGRDVFKVAVESLAQAVEDTLAANQISADDVDWLIPHQANSRIINLVAERLKFPLSKVILTVAEHANTSSASIPLALDYGIEQGLIKRGQTLVFEAFGGGVTWGSALVKY